MSNKPERIHLHRKRRELEIVFSGATYSLEAELLRVYSPSAEVYGHGNDKPSHPAGKRDVGINAVAAAGQYALQITFDDGHDSGIFTWDWLYTLATDKKTFWTVYEEQLQQRGLSRDPYTQIIQFPPLPAD